MSPRLFLVLLAAAVPFAAGACGSSSSSSSAAHSTTPSASSTSASAFIASADAVCKAGNAALAPIKTLSSSTTNTAAQQILQNASGAFTVAVDQLAALTPPLSLAGSWGTYVSDLKQEETDISGMADAIGAGDSASLTRDLNQAHQLTLQAKQALAGKGFSHCGTGT